MTTDLTGGPWTSHGHPIPGITLHGSGRPPVARCGGPAICPKCAVEAGRLTASPAPDLSPAEAATLARIEAAPYAPESFDATAALRRVLALADEADQRVRQSVPGSAAERLIAEGSHTIRVRDIRAAVNGDPS